MRLSNQGQTLDSKAGVGGVWNYMLKKMSSEFYSEIAIQAIENSEEGKNKKIWNARTWKTWFFSGLFAMQNICWKCLLRVCVRSTAIFFVPSLLLIIQSFSHKFLLDIQCLNKYLKCLCVVRRPKFLSLEKETSFINGNLLILESFHFSWCF